MGNQTSSDAGLEQSADAEEASRPQLQAADQAWVAPSEQPAPERARFPFDRSDVIHFPSLDEALRYDPGSIPPRTGPSIETLANLYPCVFPQSGLVPEPPRGPEQEAAVDAYFARLGESAPTAVACQLPDLPFRAAASGPAWEAANEDPPAAGPMSIRPPPAWQVAAEPSTTSLSITYLPTGDFDGMSSAVVDRNTAPAAADAATATAAAAPPAAAGTPTAAAGSSRSRLGGASALATAREPTSGQGRRVVRTVKPLSALLMDDFTSDLSSEELLSPTEAAAAAATPGRSATATPSRGPSATLRQGASPFIAAAVTPAAASAAAMAAAAALVAPAAAAGVPRPVLSMQPRLGTPVATAAVPQAPAPSTAVLPPAQAKRTSGIVMADSVAVWLQNPASDNNAEQQLLIQQQQQQPQQRPWQLPLPGPGTGWPGLTGAAAQRAGAAGGSGRSGEGAGGRSPAGGNEGSDGPGASGSRSAEGGVPGTGGGAGISEVLPTTGSGWRGDPAEGADVGGGSDFRDGRTQGLGVNHFAAGRGGGLILGSGGAGASRGSSGDIAAGGGGSGCGDVAGRGSRSARGSKVSGAAGGGLDSSGNGGVPTVVATESGGSGDIHTTRQYGPSSGSFRRLASAGDRTFGGSGSLRNGSSSRPGEGIAGIRSDSAAAMDVGGGGGVAAGGASSLAGRVASEAAPQAEAGSVIAIHMSGRLETGQSSGLGLEPGPGRDSRPSLGPEPYLEPSPRPGQRPHSRPGPAPRPGSGAGLGPGPSSEPVRGFAPAAQRGSCSTWPTAAAAAHHPDLSRLAWLQPPGGSNGGAGLRGSSSAPAASLGLLPLQLRAPQPPPQQHQQSTGQQVLLDAPQGAAPPRAGPRCGPSDSGAEDTSGNGGGPGGEGGGGSRRQDVLAETPAGAGRSVRLQHLPTPFFEVQRIQPLAGGGSAAAPAAAAAAVAGSIARTQVDPWADTQGIDTTRDTSGTTASAVPPRAAGAPSVAALTGSPAGSGAHPRWEPDLAAASRCPDAPERPPWSAEPQAPSGSAGPAVQPAWLHVSVAAGVPELPYHLPSASSPRPPASNSLCLPLAAARATPPPPPLPPPPPPATYADEDPEDLLHGFLRSASGSDSLYDTAMYNILPSAVELRVVLASNNRGFLTPPEAHAAATAALEGFARAATVGGAELRPGAILVGAPGGFAPHDADFRFTAISGGALSQPPDAAMPSIPPPPLPPSTLPLPPLPWQRTSQALDLECVRPGPPSTSMSTPTHEAAQQRLAQGQIGAAIGEGGGAPLAERAGGSGDPDGRSPEAAAKTGPGSSSLRWPQPQSKPWEGPPMAHLDAELSWDSSGGPAGGRPNLWPPPPPQRQHQAGCEVAPLQVGPAQVQVHVNLDAHSLRDVFQQCLQAAVPAVCAAAAAAAVLGQGALQGARGGAGGDTTAAGAAAAAAAALGGASLPIRPASRNAQRLGAGLGLAPGLDPGIGAGPGRNAATQTASPPHDQEASTEPPQRLLGHDAPAASQEPSAPGSSWPGFPAGMTPGGADLYGRGPPPLLRSTSPARSELLRRNAMATPALGAPAAAAFSSWAPGAWRAEARPFSTWSSPDRAAAAAADPAAFAAAAPAARWTPGSGGGDGGASTAAPSVRGSLSLATFSALPPAACKPPTTGAAAGAASGALVAEAAPVFQSWAAANLFEECRREIHKRAAAGPPGLARGDRQMRDWAQGTEAISASGVRPPADACAATASAVTANGGGGGGGFLCWKENVGSSSAALGDVKRRRLSPLRPTGEPGDALRYGVATGGGGAAAAAAAAAAVVQDSGAAVRTASRIALARAEAADAVSLNPVLLRFAPPSLAAMELQASVAAAAGTVPPAPPQARAPASALGPEPWLQWQPQGNSQPPPPLDATHREAQGMVPGLDEDIMLDIPGASWGPYTGLEVEVWLGPARAELPEAGGRATAGELIAASRAGAAHRTGEYSGGLAAEGLGVDARGGGDAGARGDREQVGSPLPKPERSEMLLRFLDTLDQRPLP